MMVDAMAVLKPVPGVEASRFGGEYVLLEPTGRMLRGLNATAGRVWELLDGVRNGQAIAAALAQEHAMPVGRVLPDVIQLLSQLWDRKLVEAVAPAGVPPQGAAP